MHCQAQCGTRVGELGAQGRHAAGAAHRNQFRVVVLQRRAGLVTHTCLLRSAQCAGKDEAASDFQEKTRVCQESALADHSVRLSDIQRYSLPLVPTEKASARYARAPRATKHASTHIPQISTARDSPSASLAEVREPAGRPRHTATRTCPPPPRRRRCCSHSSWAAAPSYSGRREATRPPARSTRTRPTRPPPGWSKGGGADFARGRLEQPVLLRAARPRCSRAAGAESRRGGNFKPDAPPLPPRGRARAD